LSRSTNPDPCRNAGFTLVEPLAALAIMAIALPAIGALSNTSLRSGLYVERHLATTETARKIITGIPSRKDLADDVLTGVVDNHAWRIDSGPFPNALVAPNAPVVWEPRQLVLRVSSPDGVLVEINMIRLRKREER
jgi:general secretion pathway protein I